MLRGKAIDPDCLGTFCLVFSMKKMTHKLLSDKAQKTFSFNLQNPQTWQLERPDMPILSIHFPLMKCKTVVLKDAFLTYLHKIQYGHSKGEPAQVVSSRN
ncbi:hypothetical protein TNCT_349141 [Trichonephila clavata]|uniref:Uncharacterized protein n=1 Tax=Trichonephila clavata TaxID=2740835 RepID=A0A8X6I0G3_TRICU|nr:hypothetical protein TNCT_349141 [Trichonephila clavata]